MNWLYSVRMRSKAMVLRMRELVNVLPLLLGWSEKCVCVCVCVRVRVCVRVCVCDICLSHLVFHNRKGCFRH